MPLKEPFKSVTVAVDLTEDHGRVIDHGRELARFFNAGLHIVHVVSQPNWLVRKVMARETLDNHVNTAHHEAVQKLEELARSVSGVSTTFSVRRGQVVPEILAESSEHGPGMIVCGTKADSRWRWYDIGAVSNGLLRQSEVPVLVVDRERPREFHRVVVPTEFEKRDRSALRLALALCGDHTERIDLLHAYSVPSLLHRYSGDTSVLRDEINEAASLHMKEFIAELGPIDTSKVNPVLVANIDSVRAARTIAEHVEASNSDLIVMSTGGRGVADLSFLGSTTEKLLHRLNCPLLALPRAWAERAADL